MTAIIAQAVSNKYVFPTSFKQYEVEAFVPLMQNAFDQLNLQTIVSSLRTNDHTIELAERLQDVKTKIAQVRFLNSYREDEQFVTTDRAVVVSLRKQLQSAIYKIDGFLADVKIAIETQLFLLKHTTSAEINEQTMTLNAFGNSIDTEDLVRATLAVDNLKALFQYFRSLQECSAMQTLRDDLELLNKTSPIISLGSKKYNATVDGDIDWPEAIMF